MDSIKIWIKLMFILSLIVAAVILGVILVPVLTGIGLIYLAYVLPRITKEIKNSDKGLVKPSDYFKDEFKD